MRYPIIYVLEPDTKRDSWWINRVCLIPISSPIPYVTYFTENDELLAGTKAEAILRFQIERGKSLYLRRRCQWVKCQTVEECVRANYEEL